MAPLNRREFLGSGAAALTATSLKLPLWAMPAENTGVAPHRLLLGVDY